MYESLPNTKIWYGTCYDSLRGNRRNTGKNTDNLEGYAFEDRGGYFGPGELPKFDSEFFEIPKGRSEDWLFDKFKEKVTEKGGIDSESLSEFGADLSKIMEIEDSSRGDE